MAERVRRAPAELVSKLAQAPEVASAQPRTAREMRDAMMTAARRMFPTAKIAPVTIRRRPVEDSMLSDREVRRRTGLSRTTIWRLERAGEFPERKPLSANRVAWKESEVAAWIAQRKGRRGGGAVTT